MLTACMSENYIRSHLVNFEVPVVFKRHVAHEERVVFCVEQQNAQRRQVGAVERHYQHGSNGNVAWNLLQLLLHDGSPLG